MEKPKQKIERQSKSKNEDCPASERNNSSSQIFYQNQQSVHEERFVTSVLNIYMCVST